MKISHFTWSAMSGIAFVMALLGCALLWVEGTTWLARSRGALLSEAFTSALRIADTLVIERMATRDALVSMAPDQEFRRAMTVARSGTDTMFQRLGRQVEAAGVANGDVRDHLAKGRSLLASLRISADTALASQGNPRSKFSADYFSGMSEVLAVIKPVSSPIQTVLIDIASPAATFDQLALLAVDARINAGIRSARLGEAMLASRPPTAEEKAFMERMTGRVEALFERIQALTQQLGSPEPIVGAIGAMKAGYFTAGKQIFDRHLASIEAGEPYPTTAEVFFSDIVAPLQSILSIRDAALDEGSWRTRLDRERAEIALALTALIVAVGAVGALAVGMTLRQRVIRPIGHLTATMERLADRNWAAEVLNASQDAPAEAYSHELIPAIGQRDEVGSMARAVAVFRDGLLRAETATRQLRGTQLFLDAILEHVPAPIFVKAAGDLSYVHVNRAAEVFAGMKRGSILGRTSSAVVSPEACALMEAADRAALASNETSVQDDVRLSTIHNGERLAIVTRAVIAGSDLAPEYLLLMFNDITERRRAELRVAYLAQYDALTNLPNRVTFMERLDETLAAAQRNGSRIGVLSLDIDHFAEVNDTLGHAAGDALLRGVTARLSQCLQEDDLVARLGGDEFAVIQRSMRRPQDVELLAERVIEAFRLPLEIGGQHVFVGVSLGIAINEPHLAGGELIKQADLALSDAKESGRGCYRWFMPEMDVRLNTRRTLEHDLRTAVGTSEFRLHYQPQVDLKTREILGAEVLMRWDNPQQGTISPQSFIPLAENLGLIGRLGQWLLQEACAEAMRWPAHLRIAVNVSPAQLRMPDFIATVEQALTASGLEPARLELEVTEGILLRDTEGTLASFAALRALGVKLALDDFGTGYSSLSYLQRFRFDKLKIDRSFVKGLTARPDATAIVRAVLSMSDSLGMKTVAEGMETASEVAALRALGCGQAQGFYFWRPMDAAAMRALAWQTPSSTIETASG